MVKIDEDLLKELGLEGLNEQEKQDVYARFYKTLENKVGMRVARELNEEQLEKFEEYSSKHNDEETAEWIKQAVPNYEQIVTEEFETMKTEIKDMQKGVHEQNIKDR